MIPVLETKLYIPRWPSGLVTRPRLIERVRAGSGHKLTVVSAPAGSGKTTLLAEWLAQRPADDPPVGWVSLDAADNDPVLFWTCVIRALQKVEASVGERALAELDGGAAPTVAMLTSLINQIATIDRDFTVILDDYHVIEAPSVHTALSFFLDHLPPRMHVVLASRADPLLPIARMRARGEVIEVRAADLCFTTDEATSFLNRVMSLNLAATDVAALEQRTEGWIAGLKLAALSIQGQDDVPAFIRSFSGDHRFIADYLIEEVLQSQPEATRQFLLATAILDRLSAPLCDAVAGTTGSQAMLERLEKSNLFVIALDDRREWYRYHHLFAEVLQAHALRADAEQLRARHGRASLWYERHGSAADAVQHAQRAHDLERVAQLLERTWPAMDRSYQTGRWLAQVSALPEGIVQLRPVLNMGYAWALLNAGKLEAAERRLDDVDASITAGTNPPVVADEKRFQSLPREIALARVYLAQSRGDIAGTVEHAQRALALVGDGDHGARATAAALLALAYWAIGELEAAHATFTDALESMKLAGLMPDVIRGMFVLGDIRAAQGRLREAQRSYEAGLALAAAHAPADAETDELYLGLSELQHERGNLQEAARLLHTLEQSAARAVHTVNRHRWCIAMARIAEARGDLDSALRLLAEAETHLRRDPLPRVRPVPALKARILIAQGKLAEAQHWLNEQRIAADDDVSYLREFEHITLARWLLARHRADRDERSIHRALGLLERLTTAATSGGRQSTVIETLALQALAHHALGNTRAALDAVAAALELAEPEGYVRVFVDEGTPMRNLLAQAVARGITGAYARRIQAAFDGATNPPASPAPAASTTGAAPLLTPRELEILHLIAAGLRNQEIADQLFISAATVKRHIANVYQKLDARHRTDALKRAGALNLL